jgi:hypothetical protein
MFAAIRSRISRAYAALFAMTVIALSVFVPQTAHAGYASYSRPSMSYSRSYYSAPRVYVAPRPVVVVRPAVVVRRSVVVPVVVRPYYRPPVVIAPVIAPTQVVEADGTATQAVAVSTGPSAVEVIFVILLGIVVVAMFVGILYGGYGLCTGYIADSFAVDALICADLAIGDGIGFGGDCY